jgi:hypothetical protein
MTTIDRRSFLTGITATLVAGGIGGPKFIPGPEVKTHGLIGRTHSQADIIRSMNECWLKLCKGHDKPSMVWMGHDAYMQFYDALDSMYRFQDDRLANSGFDNLKYMSASVVTGEHPALTKPDEITYWSNYEIVGV